MTALVFVMAGAVVGASGGEEGLRSCGEEVGVFGERENIGLRGGRGGGGRGDSDPLTLPPADGEAVEPIVVVCSAGCAGRATSRAVLLGGGEGRLAWVLRLW